MGAVPVSYGALFLALSLVLGGIIGVAGVVWGRLERLEGKLDRVEELAVRTDARLERIEAMLRAR